MRPDEFHDGQRVKARCQELKLRTLDFANQMAWEHRKALRMFQRPLWTAFELAKAGKILGINFLQDYGAAHEDPNTLVIGILVKPDTLQSEAGRLRALEELNNQEKQENE